MNFAKFVSLLECESLFFTRADKLGDPFEGSYPKMNQWLRSEWLLDSGAPSYDITEVTKDISEGNKFWTRNVVVNCWHQNESESEAMWKLYGKDSGIAIKTTFKNLSDSFKSNHIVHIGKVKYIDYDSAYIPETEAFTPFLNKRKSFEYEREVRAITLGVENSNSPGKYLKVDIPTLIDEVIIAPFTQGWLVDLIKLVVKRYDLQETISESDMDDNPTW